MTDIIIKAYDVLDDFLAHPAYLDMKVLDCEIKDKHQDLLIRFREAREVYEEIMAHGGTYHPDYKEAVKTLTETKKVLYESQEVKRYIGLEKVFENDLNDFLRDLASAISPHITTSGPLGLSMKGGSCHAR